MGDNDIGWWWRAIREMWAEKCFQFSVHRLIQTFWFNENICAKICIRLSRNLSMALNTFHRPPNCSRPLLCIEFPFVARSLFHPSKAAPPIHTKFHLLRCLLEAPSLTAYAHYSYSSSRLLSQLWWWWWLLFLPIDAVCCCCFAAVYFIHTLSYIHSYSFAFANVE